MWLAPQGYPVATESEQLVTAGYVSHGNTEADAWMMNVAVHNEVFQLVVVNAARVSR